MLAYFEALKVAGTNGVGMGTPTRPPSLCCDAAIRILQLNEIANESVTKSHSATENVFKGVNIDHRQYS